MALSDLKITNVFERNLDAFLDSEKRMAVNEGGTSSTKTFSVVQLITTISYYQNQNIPLLSSIVSESLPHLKKGAIRDFKNILGNDFDNYKWNATDNIYNFDSGAQIEFFSADQPGKARGPRRDILYINEVNNVPKPIVDELSMRTRRFEFYDFNPVGEFWAHELKGRPEVSWIHSTYLDAKGVLPPEVVAKIEAKRLTDPNWWNVYGLGLVGNIEGLVHPLFKTIDEMPQGGIRFYGLDFGFTNDPTAIIHNAVIGNNLYSDQIVYEKGLTNDAIARRMESLSVRKNYDEIFAESAEPKSIAEIKAYGFNIKAVEKGADSITAGIQKVNQYAQHWTKRSVESIREQRNYRYIETSDGKITNKPIDDYNHSMDARRYAIWMKLGKPHQIAKAFDIAI